jgi:hypothetical protein
MVARRDTPLHSVRVQRERGDTGMRSRRHLQHAAQCNRGWRHGALCLSEQEGFAATTAGGLSVRHYYPALGLAAVETF